MRGKIKCRLSFCSETFLLEGGTRLDTSEYISVPIATMSRLAAHASVLRQTPEVLPRIPHTAATGQVPQGGEYSPLHPVENEDLSSVDDEGSIG